MNDLNLIKGIGKVSINNLNKLGIYTVDDLINYYPFRYEVLKNTTLNEEKVVLDSEIISTVVVNYCNRVNRLKFKILYDNKTIDVVIFNRGFLKPHLTIGKKVTIIGKYDEKNNLLTASDIKLFSLNNRVIITPKYHLVKGISSTNINKFINNALKVSKPIDLIPDLIKEKYNFLEKDLALNIIHNPVNNKKLKEAIIREKYEELFLFRLKVNELKNKNSNLNIGYSKKINKEKINEFINKLPFKLTVDQIKCLDEIFKDLNEEKRMNRLVQGDVGSGKTIVAIISMYALYLNNYQTALMAPTEILATQHYNNMLNLFKDYNINISLLTSKTSKKERKIILENLKEHKIDIVVGTHSILNDEIEFNNLGLVITDEQHRFGVNQRSNLRNKGNMPDVLYLSATPIPRTYALTIYGDMDISIIKTKPEGRKKIITKVVDNKNIKDVLKNINVELKKGHQIYIVSPLIESEEDDVLDAKNLQKKFSLAFKNYNVGLLHGKMKNKEKEEIMDKFIKNEVNILVSTTVIEVGVDVKNATMIVIFDAFKFGLATLHQLRGRVGRNSFDSYCILVTDRETERLEIMEKTSDGFVLAEEDFKLRGSGDLFGTRQSGDMNFKIANITKDYNILLKAKDDSNEILKEIDNYKNLKNILEKSLNKD